MKNKAFTPHQRFGAGFTLLELVVVIVILGVLATLGFTQYGRMVERARGAEARAIIGDIRKLAYAYRLQNGTITGIADNDINIGTAQDQIPYTCRSSHYFWYDLGTVSDPTINIYAIRCTSGGKGPQGTAANALRLTTNLTTGQDTWYSDGGY